MSLSEQQLMDALKSVIDPKTAHDFVSTNANSNLAERNGDLEFYE